MKKIYHYISLLILSLPLMANAQKKDSSAIVAYINQYKDIAISEMKRSGVPASITLAQGIHESSFGKSYLAVNTNNHFGIKCKDTWTGKTFKYTDDAPNECFRVYETVEDSYRDHSDFLKYRPRYAELFQLDITDYKGWSYGLKKAGYATNPKYPEILIKTIEDYQLHAFDKGINPSYISVPSTPTITQTYEDEEYQVTDSMEVEAPKPVVPEKKTEYKPIPTTSSNQPVTTKAVNKKITLVNNVKTVKLNKGETPELIANIYAIELEKLLAFNDVNDVAELKEGQVIFIQQKKKNNSEGTYKVKPEDNLWSISQKKGVRLASLMKMNKLSEGEEPSPKTALVLKGKAKEKPELRIISTNTTAPQNSKSNSIAPEIVRARDTVYPPIKEELVSTIDKDKVLGWENDTKLKEDKKPVIYEVTEPQKKETPIAPKTEIQKQPEVSKPIETAKTTYPAVIDYDNLPKSSTGWHTVVKGDTMYNICKRYKISIAEFMEWNKLSEQTVKLGQQLKIQP